MTLPAPGSSEHQLLLSLVSRKLRASENALSPRHEDWRRSERSYRLYVAPEEIQGPREMLSDSAELLYTAPTSIVVPLSFAMTQTVVAFWVSMFTSDRLPFLITARDPASPGAARAQELLVAYQLEQLGWPTILHAWLLDACRYGFGTTKISWDLRYRNQTMRRFMDFPGPSGEVIRLQLKEKRPVLEYEGNDIEVIDPFAWRPDPRWPIGQFQRGGCCGEQLWRSMTELLQRQADGIYRHVEEIPKYTTDHFRTAQSDRDRIMNTNAQFGSTWDDPDGLVMVEEIAADVIPAQYGLSESKAPERYLFTLANKSVLLRADPFPYDHNDFTYAAIESSPDWHSLTNPGLIEIMEPVHQHITWLVNSMLENARKALNDRLVVDPAIVNMQDVLNPAAGKAIRINQDFWGVPGAVKSGVNQLNVSDVSAQNFQHVGYLVDLINRISAANETMQGQITQEERTATEIASASQQGANRLRVLARLFATSGLVPMGRQMVQNNMQFLSQEQYLRVVGSLDRDFQGVGRAVSGNGLLITPEDIQGQFAFSVSDPSSPLDPVRFARTWVQVMQVSLQNPSFAQQVNMPAVWMEMIRALGIQDPARFLLPQQVQVMPDQQLQQQVQAGNLVPQNATPPLRAPIPQQPQPQSIQGEENRPQ